MAAGAERRDGILILEVRAKAGERVVAVRGLLTKLVVGETDGASPLFARRIAIDGREKAPFEFRVPVPVGEYDKLTLGFADLVLTTAEEREEKAGFAHAESTFPARLRISAEEPVRAVFFLDLDGLQRAKAPGDVLALAVDDATPEATFEAPKGEAVTLRLGLHSIDLGARSLPAGTRIVLRTPPADDLPALFRRQVRVGAPLFVEVAAKLAAPAEVTVPYDAARLAAAGVGPADAVVMQLDDARTLYRELRPIRVDATKSTLTVRVRSFSTFFACTAGIEIRSPELIADGFGRVLGFVGGDSATVAGRAADPEAEVALLRPAATRSWAQGGWFDFEGLPFDGADAAVTLEARVAAELPHVCEFRVRRAIEPRRITDPHRPFGAALAVTSSDRPAVTTVVKFQRFREDELFPPLAGWQRSYQRVGPFLYRPTAERNEWEWKHLLPESHFENQAAALAIRLLAPLVPVPIDPSLEESTRALRSLAAFAAGLGPDDLRRTAILVALDQTRSRFDENTLAISPRAPIVSLGGERLGAAFVAATLAATDEALQGTLGVILRDLYGTFTQVPLARPQPRAGRLFWAAGEFNAISREVVADGIWCAAVALALDPQNGQPVIAAIGSVPDVPFVKPDGTQTTEPRSRVLLFRRDEDGLWSEEVVLDDRAVVDLDLAIGEDGEPRLVAAVSAAADFANKTHLVTIRRTAGGWRATPVSIEVETEGRAHRTDRGIWPRIAIDGRGRSVIVFAEWLAVWRWHVAVEAPGGFRARMIREARWLDFAGSPLQQTSPVHLDVPAESAGLSVAHWAASIALDGPTHLWCAYPNGMLNLARIDLDTLEIEDSPVAVDRSIGFFPALGVRRDGAPAVVFKDPFSPDQKDKDDLLFLSTDDGAIVPGVPIAAGTGSRFGPLLPPYVANFLSTREFAPQVPLDCFHLKDLPGLPGLLASIILHRRFHIEIYPDGGLGLPSYLAFRQSHPALSARIHQLPALPTVLVFTIDNRDFPDEGIERVVITAFPEPILKLPIELATGLDDGTVSAPLVAALAAQGLSLHTDALTVSVKSPGSSWDVLDARASQTGLSTFPQLYQLRKEQLAGEEEGEAVDRLIVRLPAVLSVVGRGEVPRDTNGRPAPCDTEQEDWDLLAGPFIQRFADSPLDIPRDSPGRAVFVALRDLRVTRFEPWDPQGTDQQGGVRFTLEIPNLSGRNEEPDATFYSVEPSFLRITLAPSVIDGRLDWWVRETAIRIGRIEADVDFGVFDALRYTLGLLPIFGHLLLLADPIADWVATFEVNGSLGRPDSATFESLFQEVMNGWFSSVLGPKPGLESVYLRDGNLRLWSRSAAAGSAPSAQLEVQPRAGLSFPTVRLGEEPARRNLLLSNVGGVPALVESIRVTSGGPEMRIDGPIPGPWVLEPGAVVTVPVLFAPEAPAGFRAGQLEVIANGDATPIFVPLRGLAAAPLVPAIRLRPSIQLAFGAVTVGRRWEESVEIQNEGLANLLLAPPRIEGDPALVAAFSIVSPPSLDVPPGGTAVLRIVFAPALSGPSRYEARLVLESNDPAQPRLQLPIVGLASGLGSVFVDSLTLVFNDTIITANQTPLPPGLPPTIHLGSTRTTRIINLGPGPLTVLGATFQIPQPGGSPSPHFRLWLADGTAPAQIDRVLPGGGELTLAVEFLPTTVGPHQGTLTLRTSDSVQPVIAVTLAGVGVL